MAEEKKSKKKGRTPQESSIDPAAIEMLIRADELGLETAFTRADKMAPCPIGSNGTCCKVCFMGPCRVVKDGHHYFFASIKHGELRMTEELETGCTDLLYTQFSPTEAIDRKEASTSTLGSGWE